LKATMSENIIRRRMMCGSQFVLSLITKLFTPPYPGSVSSENTSRPIRARLMYSWKEAKIANVGAELTRIVVPSTVERPLRVGGAETMVVTR